MRIRYKDTPNMEAVEQILENLNLNTVCREANCPNYMECFSRKTATFMILGTACTRDCRFCNVRHGEPLPPDPEEPQNVARAVKELGLQYVVITSVTRDDLPDGGAEHFAEVISAIKEYAPETAIEVLIPDFKGDLSALKTITDASPTVISHNMEAVKSLYSDVRPQAEYRRSLNVLKNIKELNPKIRSKSGIMVGLGETREQVYELFDDLREACCEFLTIGQYLAPTKEHLQVQEYIEPSAFEEYKTAATQKGFEFVASAPFVRSSYHAGEALGR
jgi:lipoic acid synthetase